jgi:hypothetical protein
MLRFREGNGTPVSERSPLGQSSGQRKRLLVPFRSETKYYP